MASHLDIDVDIVVIVVVVVVIIIVCIVEIGAILFLHLMIYTCIFNLFSSFWATVHPSTSSRTVVVLIDLFLLHLSREYAEWREYLWKVSINFIGF